MYCHSFCALTFCAISALLHCHSSAIATQSPSSSLFVFDFDQTMTKSDSLIFGRIGIAENIKPYTADTFRAIMRSGNHLAIATFNSDLALINEYLKVFLEEEEIAAIKIIYRDDISYFFSPATGKASYIKGALAYFESQRHVQIKNVYYYDDHPENIASFEAAFLTSEWTSIYFEGILVERQPDHILHYEHTCRALAAQPSEFCSFATRQLQW